VSEMPSKRAGAGRVRRFRRYEFNFSYPGGQQARRGFVGKDAGEARTAAEHWAKAAGATLVGPA
jgi:hypothetical protein